MKKERVAISIQIIVKLLLSQSRNSKCVSCAFSFYACFKEYIEILCDGFKKLIVLIIKNMWDKIWSFFS
jgi:hypothetical protein